MIGAAVRGVATTEFADIPWIQRALRKIKDRIESSTGEDYRAFNNYGTTWLASVVPEFSRSQASGEELPGGWYWLDRYDPLADAKAGLRTWVKESGGVVIG